MAYHGGGPKNIMKNPRNTGGQVFHVACGCVGLLHKKRKYINSSEDFDKGVKKLFSSLNDVAFCGILPMYIVIFLYEYICMNIRNMYDWLQ